MEEKKVVSHLQKGLIIGLVLILVGIATEFLGFKRDSWQVQLLSTVILVGGIIWSCWYYGKQKDNYVTFGNLFAHGFKTTSVIAIIVIVFTIVYFVVFPEFKEDAINQAREQAERRGNQSDEQIEEGMKFFRRMFIPLTVGFILIIYAIIGAISSLIGAAITKKNPFSPLDQLP